MQELLEAGRVLQAERDALQKLVGSAAAATSCPAGGSGSSGAGCMAAGALGAEVPPLGDATNSPGAVPAMARSPSLAGSGEYEGGLLQRYRVSASGIQPAVAAAPASSGAAIPASWGGRAGGGRQATGSPRPTSPAARNKLLVGGGWWVQEAEARRVHHQILPAAEMQCCVLISMPRPTNLSSLLPSLPTQVKSGSSFNAMVRALKQELVSSGALARGTGPTALYEVDKASGRVWPALWSKIPCLASAVSRPAGAAAAPVAVHAKPRPVLLPVYLLLNSSLPPTTPCSSRSTGWWCTMPHMLRWRRSAARTGGAWRLAAATHPRPSGSH